MKCCNSADVFFCTRDYEIFDPSGHLGTKTAKNPQNLKIIRNFHKKSVQIYKVGCFLDVKYFLTENCVLCYIYKKIKINSKYKNKAKKDIKKVDAHSNSLFTT